MLKSLRAFFVDLFALPSLVRAFVWYETVRPCGFGFLFQKDERYSEMSQVFTYVQGLITPPAGVANQRLVVSVDGTAQDPIIVDAAATSVEFKVGPAGATVVVSLAYEDAAGNVSDAIENQFVIVDKIPPVAPAGFGEITQTAEEDVA